MTLDVTFIPHGEPTELLKQRLQSLVDQANENGTITGEGVSEMDRYGVCIEEVSLKDGE